MRPRETTSEAHAVQLEVYLAMAPSRRLRLVFETSERAREMAISGAMAREQMRCQREAGGRCSLAS